MLQTLLHKIAPNDVTLIAILQYSFAESVQYYPFYKTDSRLSAKLPYKHTSNEKKRW